MKRGVKESCCKFFGHVRNDCFCGDMVSHLLQRLIAAAMVLELYLTQGFATSPDVLCLCTQVSWLSAPGLKDTLQGVYVKRQNISAMAMDGGTFSTKICST